MTQVPMPATRPGRFKPVPVVVLLFLVVGVGLARRTSVVEKPPLADPKAVPAAAERSAPGSLSAILSHPDLIPSHNHPLVGREAPDFQLADPDGKVRGLRELQGDASAVVIFYFGLHCRNCVRQLDDLNRDLPLFHEAGARVIAISADSPEVTREGLQQHGRFAFTVLADPDHKVAHLYEVFREDLPRHGTFLLDAAGMVRWANVGDAPLRRNSALLCQLWHMAGGLPWRQPRP